MIHVGCLNVVRPWGVFFLVIEKLKVVLKDSLYFYRQLPVLPWRFCRWRY